MEILKQDFPPLLAPGRHYMSLAEVERRFVVAFDGESRSHRDKLFRDLEEIVQTLLRVKLPCRICVDGSFLTEKPKPDDIDIVVWLDYDLTHIMSEPQRQIIDLLNGSNDFKNIDSSAWFNYPRGHEQFGSGIDGYAAAEDYGMEHGGQHLKGYVVLRLQETDVGLRICR